MPLGKSTIWKRLSDLWEDTEVRTLEMEGMKYAILSDTHFGDGGDADDFHRNEPVLLAALESYRSQGYALILLGDIEELWQFDLARIVERYRGSVYSKIRTFGDDRVFRVFGNHDLEWGGYRDPTKENGGQPSLADEALKLKDSSGKARLLLVHGHQGSIESDKFAWFSRFFVRLFKSIEPVVKLTGLYGHSSATKSQVKKDFERTLYTWAKDNKVILMCGHSHRAIFASKSYAETRLDEIADLQAENAMSDTSRDTRRANYRKIAELQKQYEDEKEKGRVIEPTDPDGEPLPCYFNCGCGLYTDGVTAIEIADGMIRLVKWDQDTKKEPKVYNADSLNDFLQQVAEAGA
jgi:UDP-2,3-diacylglucosamine pyrophosphatase LpxH